MPQFNRAVIVGVGLLGGSIGLALQRRKLAAEVIGTGRRESTLREAQSLGAITAVELDLCRACDAADLIVVCTPVQSVASQAIACLTMNLARDCLITDVGSTKATICEAIPATGHQYFCGSHPMAGSDKSGVTFATADLFENRLTIVTPTPETPPILTERTHDLWKSLGSRTVQMQPLEHDEAIAQTSHLPHLVASALAAETQQELLPLAASGWCDTTRVAAGGVDLWRQIIIENRTPVLRALKNFSDSLQEWISVLDSGNEQRLTELLESGKQKRDSVGN